MSAKKKRKRKQKQFTLFKKLIFVAVMVLTPIITIQVFNLFPSTFSVSVKTELLKFKTIDHNNSKIPLYDVKVFIREDDSIGIDGYHGTFKIATGATTTIERISNSYLTIEIKVSKGESAGTFYSPDDDEVTHKADNYVLFYIDDIADRINRGETIIVPITGEITIGRTINYETYGNSNAIVRCGGVTVIGRSIFWGPYFKSNTYDLNTGDQFIITNYDKDKKVKVYGFATINEEIGMTATYKAIGKEGIIITPGPMDDNSGYNISTTIFDRFEKDRNVKIISLMFVILVTIADILPLVKEVFPDVLSKSKKKK
ncbi:hypothetical protein Q4Q35_07495 [Flavivirga aquimarina]|uniref:Uncharacterized protein n=1 Tax=Flavivirga aquimarina TaxID=2027862 RepID=A0ABT8W938_9FLAO|nr:hypothetical protein [Flavivirga aquimarina]MDO5969647.1 hypothetical protein [Flavivirga aquimarina]